MPSQNPQKQLSRRDIRALATVAQCDERTVTAVLAGVRTHAATAARVRAALLTLGLGGEPTPQAISSAPQAR